MDQHSADGRARPSVRARRRQLRADVRAERRAGVVPDRFQTPQWLERSFVLPVTDGGVTVPSQPQPHHDDYPETSTAERPAATGGETDPAAPFVRPPSQEIDFARMIKRSDHCRTASRVAMASIGFAGLALVAFLVTMNRVPFMVAIGFAVLAAIAAGVRVRLVTAPVAHLAR
ncbi:MAG TPA: hypothetical protein VNS49_14250 [Streptomyces sp.]|nr:hypothetical protein [Streptomyces sp.]